MDHAFRKSRLQLVVLIFLILGISFHFLTKNSNSQVEIREDRRGQMSTNPETDWPMARHDPQMTGHTPLKGKMLQAPEVVWRHYLGLWSNHLVVTASSGASNTITLPKKSFGEGYLQEHSLAWGLRQPAVDIDGKGTLVDLPNQYSVKLAKLLPEVPGLQRVEFDNAFSTSSEAGYGRMYAYDEGADKPRLVWQTEKVKDLGFLIFP